MPHIDNTNSNGNNELVEKYRNYRISDEWVKYGFEYNHKFEYRLLDFDPVCDQVIGWFKKNPGDHLTLCKWHHKTGRCIVGYDNVPEFDLKKDELWRIMITGFNASSIEHAGKVWDNFLAYAARVGLFKTTRVTTVDRIRTTEYFLKMMHTLLKDKSQNNNFISFSQILEYIKKDL